MKDLTSLKSCVSARIPLLGGSGAALAALFPRLQDLTELDMSQEYRLQSAAQAIVPGLVKLSTLQSLNVSHFHIRSKGLEALHSSVKGLANLKSLNLSNNALHKAVACLLSELTSLEHRYQSARACDEKSAGAPHTACRGWSLHSKCFQRSGPVFSYLQIFDRAQHLRYLRYCFDLLLPTQLLHTSALGGLVW